MHPFFSQPYNTNDFWTSDTFGQGKGKNGLPLRIMSPFLNFFSIPTLKCEDFALSVQSPLVLGIIKSTFELLRRVP